MLATSDDLYNNVNPVLRCRSYTDVKDKIEALSALPNPNTETYVNADLIWLADQIRMRFRLEPIGFDKGRIIIGTGRIPQVALWYGSRQTTKGDTRTQFNLISPKINNAKGDKHVIRSDSAKGLARRLKAEMFKGIDLNCVFGDPYDVLAQINNEIHLGGRRNYVPHMEDNVRLDAYNFFSGRDTEPSDVIKAWVRDKGEVIAANNRILDRQDFVRDCFRKRFVVLYALPMDAEFKFCLREYSLTSDSALQPATEYVFFEDVEDLIDAYPHIVATENIMRVQNSSGVRNQILFRAAYGFSPDLSFIAKSITSPIFRHYVKIAVFPAERIPSEDERKAATPSTPAVNPAADDNKLSVLSF